MLTTETPFTLRKPINGTFAMIKPKTKYRNRTSHVLFTTFPHVIK